MESEAGLSIVRESEPDTAHTVDIVSVHDLLGRDAAWRSDAQRFTGFIGHDIPAARILSFSYDRSQSVHDSATCLLRGLTQVWEDSRTDRQTTSLIFVAHSLGGIIVKAALTQRISHLDVSPSALARHTSGIIFVSTPHRSDVSSVRSFLQNFDICFPRLSLTGDSLRTDLRRVDEVQTVQLSFQASLEKDLEHIDLVSFFEELPSLGSEIVVRLHDVILNSFRVLPLHTSHLVGQESYMLGSVLTTRESVFSFWGRTEPKYALLLGELKKFSQRVVTLHQPTIEEKALRLNTAHSGLATVAACAHDITKCYDSVCQCRNVVSPVTGTASWLLSHKRFRDWLTTPKPAILWLTGKPGSGKSVLLKFLVDSFTKSSSKPDTSLTAHFFFQGFQNSLKQTTMDLLRSLLFQTRVDRDKSCPTPSSRDARSVAISWGNNLSTLKQRLRRHLHVAMKFRPVVLIIDGLDEIARPDAVDILAYFREMIDHGGLGALRICLSWRVQGIPRNFEDILVSVDKENRDDISTFVQGQIMKYQSRDHTMSDPQELIEKISSKSSGMFVWAALALQYALYENASGRDLATLLKRLPPDLESIYNVVLERRMYEMQDNVVQLISFIALARRPLTMEEVFTTVSWKGHNIDQTVLRSLVTDCVCRHHRLDAFYYLQEVTYGLVQVEKLAVTQADDCEPGTVSSEPWTLVTVHDSKVWLIHRSAADFLLKHSLNQLSAHSSDLSKMRAGIHLDIAQACRTYILESTDGFRNKRDYLSSGSTAAAYPLLRYSATYWFSHLRAAVLEDVDLEFSRLIRWPSEQEMILASEACEYVYGDFCSPGNRSWTFLHVVAYYGLSRTLSPFSNGEMFTNETNVAVDAQTKDGRTALSLAVEYGHQDVVEKLLALGANVKARDFVFGNSAIHWAAYSPSTPATVEIVKLLVRAGANVNDQSNGTSPVALAAACGNHQALKTLLDLDADPNTKDIHSQQSALSLAISSRNIEAVELLVRHKVHFNSPDDETGLTPLHIAVLSRSRDLVGFLLSEGAIVSLLEVDEAPKNAVSKSALQLPHNAAHDSDAKAAPPLSSTSGWLNRVLLLWRDSPTYRTKTGGAEGRQSSSDNRSNSSGAQNAYPSVQNTHAGQKRVDQDDNDDTNDNQGSPSKRRNIGSPPVDAVQERQTFLRCPYAAFDPITYEQKPECLHGHWPTVSRLKSQHLYSYHQGQLCYRCNVYFPDHPDRNAALKLKHHLENPVCDSPKKARNYADGFDQDQCLQLKARKGPHKCGGEVECWNRVYQILFPDAAISIGIPSAFMQPSYATFMAFRHAHPLRDNMNLNARLSSIVGTGGSDLNTQVASILEAVEEILAAQDRHFIASTRRTIPAITTDTNPITYPSTSTQPASTGAVQEDAPHRSSYYQPRHAYTDIGQPSGRTSTSQQHHLPRSPVLPATAYFYKPNIAVSNPAAVCYPDGCQQPQHWVSNQMPWDSYRDAPTASTSESRQAFSDFGFNANGGSSSMGFGDQSLPDTNIEGWDPLACPSPLGEPYVEDMLQPLSTVTEHKDGHLEPVQTKEQGTPRPGARKE